MLFHSHSLCFIGLQPFSFSRLVKELHQQIQQSICQPATAVKDLVCKDYLNLCVLSICVFCFSWALVRIPLGQDLEFGSIASAGTGES